MVICSINMRTTHLYIILGASLLGAACSSDDFGGTEPVAHEFMLSSDVVPFRDSTGLPIVSEVLSRSKMDGTGFEDGDWIRLKIICPFVDSSEYGESTWGNSYDAFFLLKRAGGWTYLTANDHCDITGSYSYSGSPQVGSFTEAQQTPYVYMASTWTEEKNFRSASGSHVLQYCHVFHADQRKAEHYKASDLLWAQQYMQTGAWNVHLNFEHKMACIDFTIDDSQLDPVLTEADIYLTLEGMPDIDQQEIIVGDYYAPRSKINSRFGYREKNSALYAYNGRVIGIGVNDDSQKSTLDNARGRAVCIPMTGCPNPAYDKTYADSEFVPNTGTYTAYKDPANARHFRLIVPPCELPEGHNAQIWVRCGQRRFSMPLTRRQFREGELYPVTVNIK